MISAVLMAASTEPDAVRVPDPDIVSPGFAGFLTVFVLACVTVLLIRSMTGHMRKAKFLADERDRAEQAAGQETQAGSQGS
ncbi:hypothetical protein LWF15_05870 [Kineosporia rhizophila]|uniref:hypothetical protein n=1 Tax=Kineosporia TaxID=49184 RepID=UPI000A87DEE3|nr:MULTISPECIES: hypothetical protein [Kineosporia]MCE0535031.1 hypothetical protein [Kineosporia rhizophila]GLY14685.1 hypothetical protein Kisp01_17000 [Kineosporia sp. NBRC 101677]